MEWYIYAFGAAIFAAIASILNKKILSHEHALEFAASRNIILLILSLIIIPFVNLNIPWGVYISIYFVSLLITAGMIFYMKSMRHGEISTVSPLMNISPLFLLIIAFLVLGETPTFRQYGGVILLIIGAYSLETGIINKGFFSPIKVFIKSKVIHHLVFALVIFSLGATLDKLIITKYTTWTTYLFLLIVFKAVNLISLEIYRHGFSEIQKDLKKDLKLLILDSVSVFLANISYFIAVSISGALITLIIPIKRTASLFTTMLGGKLFHEENLLVKVLACIIMLWGAVFIIL